MSIEVKNLSFSYGKKQILHDISFRAEKGEFLSVLGPNGAGKSTLFRCILGLLPDYSGEVLINGHDIKNFSAREASRQIAYIPQNSTPTFHYSVLDIVLMGRTNRAGTFGNPGKEDEQASLAALEKILPPTVTAENIYVSLGSPLVTPEMIDDFIAHILRLDRGFSGTKHDEITGTWEIPDKNIFKYICLTFHWHINHVKWCYSYDQNDYSCYKSDFIQMFRNDY